MHQPKLKRLKEELVHSDVETRRAAAEQLASTGSGALPVLAQLIDATADQDEVVRYYALQAIGSLGVSAASAIQRLIQVLCDESESENVRKTAGYVLSRMGRHSLPQVVAQLRSQSPFARRLAINSLLRNVAALSEDRQTLAETLGILTELLGDENDDNRLFASNLLATLGEPALPYLRQALRSLDRYVQINAARALFRFEPWHPSHGSIDDLVLGNDKLVPKVLCSTSRSALSVLAGILKQSDCAVRKEALLAIGEINEGASDALPAIIECIKSGDTETREWAMCVIGQIGSAGSNAVPLLINELQDPNPKIRMSAASALGNIGECTESVRAALLVALSDSVPDVTFAAASALLQIAGDVDSVKSAIRKAMDACPREDLRAEFSQILGIAIGSVDQRTKRE